MSVGYESIWAESDIPQGIEMQQASIDERSFPSGSYWKNEANS
jgi:hypothetical protein